MEIMSHTTYMITHARKGVLLVRVNYVSDVWVDGCICHTNDARIKHHPDYPPGSLICIRKSFIETAQLATEWLRDHPASNEEPTR